MNSNHLSGWLRLRTAHTASLLWLVLTLVTGVQAQFLYRLDNNTITITGYTGPGGTLVIPDVIDGLPVTRIGYSAFELNTTLTSVTIPGSVISIEGFAFVYCTNLNSATLLHGVTSIENSAFSHCISLTNVAIPGSVTSIGSAAFVLCTNLANITIPSSVTNIVQGAFASCTSLSAITVDALNSFYSSVDGVLFNKSQTLLIQYPGGKAGTYTIPNSVSSIENGAFAYCTSVTSVNIPGTVTSIGNDAFWSCSGLTSVTIPASVTSIKSYTFAFCTSLTSITVPASITDIAYAAFAYCVNLSGVYFRGNAPGEGGDVFFGDSYATVYYLPGTTGWGAAFAGRPTVLWNPVIETTDASFGVRTNRFGFTITATSELVLVVEACTNLTKPSWSPVGTNTLTGGSSYFSDPEWTNHPVRFYRLQSP